MTHRRVSPRIMLAGSALLALTACEEPLDWDLRNQVGNGAATSNAALGATADRPQPDARGIISYPGYQVAVARRGDTVNSLAARIGANASQLASFNGVKPEDNLRDGEVLALPGRVAEPSGGPIQPNGNVDISTLAGSAIDKADSQTVKTSTLSPSPIQQTGVEPIRHKVERGETAFTIARLYNVSVRSLSEWNGLDSNFTVREGQFLMIPVALPGKKNEPFDAGAATVTTSTPGSGSPTPTPPSASKPLPDEKTVPVSEPVKTTTIAPDLGAEQSKSTARMGYPVQGNIVRDYEKGKNEGIDIAAKAGSAVKSAADGVVAAVTQDTRGTSIIVIKHPGNLLTVYSNIDAVAVKKGGAVNRGQKIAQISKQGAEALHFEIRKGTDSTDPIPYLK
ncbi:M23 family metallopeptidase [Roseovarius sp. EL26]|uniref:M23 family metallopeptidase n=1 Tax=Roseovarius sp. EL26 TaxID=2126672 RepID=UPI000EA0D9E3|nr:M23 family metallopeptidase [Roseovarius sp. EL26]